MRHLLQSFASTGTIQAVNLLTGILVARLLLPEGRGELAVILLWPNLMLALGFLGLDQAVIYHSARERRRAWAVVRAALLPGALLMAATAAAGWFLLPLILEPQHGDLIRLSRSFLLVSTPLHLFTNLLMAVLLGRQEILQWNLLRLVQPLCYLLGLLALWGLGAATVTNTLAAFLASAAMTLAALLPLATRSWRASGSGGAPPRRAVLGYAGRVHLQALCQIVNRRIDQALISLYLAASDLGLYVVAFALAGTLTMAAGTIGMVAFPKVAHLGSAEGKQSLFGRYFRFTLALLVCGAAGLWLFGGWLLELLFGASYAAAAPVLDVLVLGSALAGLSNCLAFGYKAHDRLGVVALGALLSLVAAAPAFALLLPILGLIGAAWATVAIHGVSLLYYLARLSGSLGLHPLMLFLPTAEDAALLRRYGDGLRARLR